VPADSAIVLDAPITIGYRDAARDVKINPQNLERYKNSGIVDTDDDGLLDFQEINFEIYGKKGLLVQFDEDGYIKELPLATVCSDLYINTKGKDEEKPLTYVEKGWEAFKNSAYYDDLSEITILPIISDPTSVDGDNDGILDKFDGESLRTNLHSDYIVNCINEEKIKFSDVISDEQVSICTVPITKLGFIIDFEPKVCYDEYGDPYSLDDDIKNEIINGYFDNWYIVENFTSSKVEVGLVYTEDCQKFMNIHSSPFKMLIKAVDAYPKAFETIYDGYVEDGFWVTTRDVLAGAISSQLESFYSDMGMLFDLQKNIVKIATANPNSNLYFPTDLSGFDPESEQSLQAQLVYEYQLFEKKHFNADSDTFQAAKTIQYSNQIIADFGVCIVGGIIGTGGDITIGGGLALAPETGGTSLAFVISREIAAAVGAEITATGAFLIASDATGFNNASQAMRDAEMFEKNPDLTEPSHPYDDNAKPKGTKTKTNDKMDEVTRSSLEMENEAAKTIAKNGYDIEQNPIVNNSSKNPDYKIEGKIFDCYSPDTNTSVRNIWSTVEDKVVKKSQTRRIVLNLDRWTGNINDLTTQFENYAIEGLVEILIVHDGDVFRFYPIR
jgi:hypothetical protein